MSAHWHFLVAVVLVPKVENFLFSFRVCYTQFDIGEFASLTPPTECCHVGCDGELCIDMLLDIYRYVRKNQKVLNKFFLSRISSLLLEP